jgi:hypothetical protein
MRLQMFFSKNRDVDMSTGPLFGNILLFALPIMAMNILQLVFNAADMIVVGPFSGREALAAVGATGSLINLIVTLFMGLSVGTSVIVAQDYGADRHADVSRSVHTSIAVSIIGGAIVMIAGIVFCKPLLEMMGTPWILSDLSELYMKIYFWDTCQYGIQFWCSDPAGNRGQPASNVLSFYSRYCKCNIKFVFRNRFRHGSCRCSMGYINFSIFVCGSYIDMPLQKSWSNTVHTKADAIYKDRLKLPMLKSACRQDFKAYCFRFPM